MYAAQGTSNRSQIACALRQDHPPELARLAAAIALETLAQPRARSPLVPGPSSATR